MTQMRWLHFPLLTKISALMLLFSAFFGVGRATHIVGAELYYECYNPFTDEYEVTLIMYRDCDAGEAPFDQIVNLFVFPTTSPGSYWIEQMFLPPITKVEPTGWDSCVGVINPPCVEKAIYRTKIKLPDRPGGYELAWARCCRNSAITNLQAPLTQGATFHIHVPGPEDANCNSSPVFNSRLPMFICAGQRFDFDHSATDPDGDSLVYSMGTPYTGVNWLGWGAGNQQSGNPPPIVDITNPMGPPPYQAVKYLGGTYTPSDPFGPNTANIDPVTGWLTFEPPSIGIYVVAVSVKEYRNGVLLSENKVDLQVHVVKCKDTGVPPDIKHDLSVIDSTNPNLSMTYGSNDTVYAVAGTPFCYQVEVTDSILTDSVIGFSVSDVFGGSNPFPPNATMTQLNSGFNPVLVEICWQPACEYIGQTIPLVVGGRDYNACENTNYVYDTVFIVILPPPTVEPKVDYDLTQAPSVGDTIIVGVDSSFCFEWWVTDKLASGHLGWEIDIKEITGASVPQPPTTTWEKFPPDSIHLRTCWTPGCDNMDKRYRVIMRAWDNSICPPDSQDFDTVYIRVLPLPNPGPVLYHDLLSNPSNGDTIYVDVHEELCYNVILNDTFPAVKLKYEFDISEISGGPVVGPQPDIQVINAADSLTIEVCWTPNCDNVDKLYRLAVLGIQENRCQQFDSAYDTIFIRVNQVFNPPPEISHEFHPGYDIAGDTIILAADSAACYDFFLRDTVGKSYLDLSWHIEASPLWDSTDHKMNISFSDTSDTLIAGTFCFNPGCSWIGQDLRVITVGKDTFDCLPTNWVYDTVWIRVIEPTNRPPVISHDLDGLNLIDSSTVMVTPDGENKTYRIVLSDPDSTWAKLIVSDTSAIFVDGWRNGNTATISWEGTNPLIMEVNWNPSCYEALNEFTIRVCGRDTSRCALMPEVCDEVTFRVDECKIEKQNVFTPNGDGINDFFVPWDMKGVETYTMYIFDRWGNRVYEIIDGPWDGSINNNGPATEGIYFWIVEYKFWSAFGEPLQNKLRGNVTLMR